MTGRLQRWREAMAVYWDRRIAIIFALGFTSGLPFLLTFGTLTVWLREEGLTRGTIGLFALVGVPYTLKFLWAPVMDHVRLGTFSRWFGRRRSWILLTQASVILAIILLGQSDPRIAPIETAIWALLLAFCSASQDIVIDAYRVEILEKEQYGAGAATIVFGYRIGLFVGGAGALFLADFQGWAFAYWGMAAAMLVGVVATILTKEPPSPPAEEFEQLAVRRFAIFGPRGQAIAERLEIAVVRPFVDFMTRPGWVLILVFIIFYKFGDSLAGVMANVFYVDLGFTKSEIASVSKTFGLIMTLVGAFLGGIFVARYSIVWALVICGVLQMLSNLMFAVQALVGHDIWMLSATIAAENISGAMGTAAFVAYLSALCNVRYTATQYALVSSFMAVARTTLAASGGYMAEAFDWFWFFVATTIAAVPGLILLYWLIKSGKTGEVSNGRQD
jgi:PAT family beta-lactamase induction signal transducer AmpG